MSLPFVPKNILTDFTVICNDTIILAHRYPLCMGSPTLAHLIYPSAMKGIDSIGLNYSSKNVILALKCIYAHLGIFSPNKDDVFSTYEEGLEFIALAKYLEINIVSLVSRLTLVGCFPEANEISYTNYMGIPKGISCLKYNTIISFMRLSFKDFLEAIKNEYNLSADDAIIICCVRWFMNIDGDKHKDLYFIMVYRIGYSENRSTAYSYRTISESTHHPICKWLQSNPSNVVKYTLKCKCCARIRDPMKETHCCSIHPSSNDTHHFINKKQQMHLKQEWLEQIYIQVGKVCAWMKDHPNINTIKVLPYIELQNK